MAIPYEPKAVFSWFDWVFFGVFCLGSLGLLIAGIVTPGNAPMGLGLLGLVCLSFWIIAWLYYWHRKQFLAKLYFVTNPGFVVIGWTENRFVVSAEQVEMQIRLLLDKIRSTCPFAINALMGCVVIFREPTWLQYIPGVVARKIAGVSDGKYIEVGWTEDLGDGALQHELAHRIIHCNGTVTGEAAEHNLMRDLGIK